MTAMEIGFTLFWYSICLACGARIGWNLIPHISDAIDAFITGFKRGRARK